MNLLLPALEVRQNPSSVLYSFAVDGKVLPRFAATCRIKRNGQRELGGYQRPEMLAHIGEIRRYLETENPMVPNAIIVAFDGRVEFRAMESGLTNGGYSRIGTLVIPVDESVPDAMKPGWIVDGQQRVAAIRESSLETFPVCVVGFISKDEREQREQFILVNSAKPLPKSLIYELLPCTDSMLPSVLERRRYPSQIVERLNFDDDSPLKGLIRTATHHAGLVKDNSMLKMIENSLYDGALFRFRDPDTGLGHTDSVLLVLKAFWLAVSQVFADGWGKPPSRSRLMHGAGIVSLGFLMDAISERHRNVRIPTMENFKDDLLPLSEICRWTNGYWDFGSNNTRKWNEIQNVPRDIQLLSNYLISQYKTRVWNQVTA